MKVRNIFGLAFRLVGVVVVMILAFIVSSMLINTDSIHLTPEEQALSGQVAILVSAINALILSYIALRSQWFGWKLIGALFLLQFGLETFMSQIETVVFRQAMNLSVEQIAPLFVTGFVRALIFAPLAVIILGRFRRKQFSGESTELNFSVKEWAARLTILAVIYVVVYFLFGYFVAWQSPDLRQFYSGSSELQPFASHMAGIISNDPMLILIQLIRGYLWVVVVLPIVYMLRGKRIETCIALAVTMAVLLSDYIFFPNPYMPEPIRMAHFTELWSSMAVFGALIGWVLLYNHAKLKRSEPIL